MVISIDVQFIRDKTARRILTGSVLMAYYFSMFFNWIPNAFVDNCTSKRERIKEIIKKTKLIPKITLAQTRIST